MNKKKIFGSIAVLAIAAMTAFNVSINTQNNGLSDVSLANVEALAAEIGGGDGGSCSCSKVCNDGKTTASCSGKQFCNCNSGFNSVSCDGASASC